MSTLTKRERVMRTVRFEETDRIPLYDILQNDAIIEHYSGRKLDYEHGDRTVAVASGKVLDMTRMVGGPQREEEATRPDGLKARQERWTSWLTDRPFRDVTELAGWVKDRILEVNRQTFGREDAARTHEYVRERLAGFAEGDPTGQGDPAVLVLESGVGLTEMYWAAGMDLFVDLLTEHPDLVEEWLEARHQAELKRVAAIADPCLIPIALTYDDIAHKTSTIFSPAWLRRHWLPRLSRLVDLWHSFDTVCLFHSDGNLWGVLDDLVEAGIDGLNPIETLAGMTVKAVREKYPRLFLAGGIDVSQLLTFGSPQEIRAVCREAIRDTGGVGYFMGSTTELHWDVPLQNAMAMFESTASP
jgi:hypothetical protein